MHRVIAYSYQFLVTTAAGYFLLTLVNAVRFTIQGMGFSVFAITSGVLEMIARTLARTCTRTADRLYRNLPGSSAGMDFCRFISDTGVFLLQEEGSEAV